MQYVYLLHNDHMPNLVKFGYTTRDPEARAAELSAATGVPGDFHVYTSWEVEDGFATEQLVFKELEAHRVPGKEFFRLAREKAVELVGLIVDRERGRQIRGLVTRLMQEPGLREDGLQMQKELWRKEQERLDEEKRLGANRLQEQMRLDAQRRSEAQAKEKAKLLSDRPTQMEELRTQVADIEPLLTTLLEERRKKLQAEEQARELAEKKAKLVEIALLTVALAFPPLYLIFRQETTFAIVVAIVEFAFVCVLVTPMIWGQDYANERRAARSLRLLEDDLARIRRGDGDELSTLIVNMPVAKQILEDPGASVDRIREVNRKLVEAARKARQKQSRS